MAEYRVKRYKPCKFHQWADNNICCYLPMTRAYTALEPLTAEGGKETSTGGISVLPDASKLITLVISIRRPSGLKENNMEIKYLSYQIAYQFE